MVTGSGEEGMKKSKGRRPQYTWIVLYCLVELYIEAIRSLDKRRGVVGFTQAAIRDCVRRYENVANPDIIKNAIYDAESHGWVARMRAHKHGRDLFIPTKSGLALVFVIVVPMRMLKLMEQPTLQTLVVPLFTSFDKAREVLREIIASFKFLLDGTIIQLKGYKSILAGKSGESAELLRVSKRLAMLEDIRDAVAGYNKGVPTATDEIRFYNVIAFLFKVILLMNSAGPIALCHEVEKIINGADPLTWGEDVRG
jgi:hypothetical protein